MNTIKLYRHPLSGHAHRVEVFLSLLGLNYELIDVDLMSGEQKSDEFLQKNPLGQVPVIEDQNMTLSDSNAILVYLAKAYDTTGQWLPEETQSATHIQRYLSIATGPVANGPALARLANLFGATIDREKTLQVSTQILTVLDSELAGKDWLSGKKPTIADVANYTYIAHAPEGGIDLSQYPNVQRWLGNFEALEGFVPMTVSETNL